MASTLELSPFTNRAWLRGWALWPAISVCAVVACAWSVATLAPIGFSIATVFLFAGPHNWLEARYMLRRMPARWGPLRIYFSLGIGGTLALAGGMAGLFWMARSNRFAPETTLAAIASWNTLLVLWIVGLAALRARQNPRREWRWLLPVALCIIAGAWLWPLLFGVALVYVHPLVALWFLDRELAKQRPQWLRAYRLGLAGLPLALVAMWMLLAHSPHLPGDEGLARTIADHAGAGLLGNVSTHLLVSTHTFLEMLHYGVWIVAIPLLVVRRWPWQLDDVPLARRSRVWRRALLSVVLMGAAVMLVLWLSFLTNYPLTRDIYFLVATLHVLAEVPFLLRLL
jgi:hypothetical protein